MSCMSDSLSGMFNLPWSFPFDGTSTNGLGHVGLGHEGILGAGLEHHVGTPPRLIVDQAPFVAFADVVYCHQYIAGPQYERLAVGGGELERPRQRDHELP